jgi:hypothetical protein
MVVTVAVAVAVVAVVAMVLLVLVVLLLLVVPMEYVERALPASTKQTKGRYRAWHANQACTSRALAPPTASSAWLVSTWVLHILVPSVRNERIDVVLCSVCYTDTREL